MLLRKISGYGSHAITQVATTRVPTCILECPIRKYLPIDHFIRLCLRHVGKHFLAFNFKLENCVYNFFDRFLSGLYKK